MATEPEPHQAQESTKQDQTLQQENQRLTKSLQQLQEGRGNERNVNLKDQVRRMEWHRNIRMLILAVFASVLLVLCYRTVVPLSWVQVAYSAVLLSAYLVIFAVLAWATVKLSRSDL